MQRIRSIDILRGLILALMAIDHVRLYGGVPAGGADLSLYFTRWVTHFCAPGFAFFAGTSIFLMAQKMDDRKKLTRFLLMRGLLLVLLEMTVIRLFWAFKINYAQFFLAGVIWMLGWCMVLMAFLIRLRPQTIAIIGLVMIVAQPVFHFAPYLLPVSARPGFALFWNFIYPTGIQIPENIAVLYVIVPWIGVMAVGHGFGLVLQMDERKRKKWCYAIGLSAIAIFLIIGTILQLLNSDPNTKTTFILRLLNQNKYPASPLFLCMTLGPLIALVPAAEKWKGTVATFLTTLGRAPMFYYLLHVILIHVSALAVNYFRDGDPHLHWYDMAPFYTQQEEGVRWSMYLLYLVWTVDLLILFFACRWYTNYRSRHPEKKWLSYI